MAKVELKQPVVKEIAEHLNGAQAAVLVDYRGLTVEQDTRLRKELREAGLVYKVYKNTMINFAIKDTEFETLAPHLEGPTAIAISKDDATAPARILFKFSKDVPKFELKAGVVDGIYYDQAGIKAIAGIPSREVLLSRLLGSLQSPIANLARVLNQIVEKGGVPVEKAAEAPAEEAPVETSVEKAAETSVAKETPAEAPVEEAVEVSAAEEAPVAEEAPAKKAPAAEEASAEAPVEKAAEAHVAEEAPAAEKTPAKKAPAAKEASAEAPVEKTAEAHVAEKTPAEAPVKKASAAEETPVKAPAKKASAKKAPAAEETPAEAPAKKTSTKKAAEAPAEEAPAE
jgi:large subunit ribosomal protein L10